MYSRLAVALGLPPGPGPEGPGGGAASSAPSSDAGGTVAGGGAVAAAAAGHVGARGFIASLAVAFAVGAVAGSVTTRLWDRDAPVPSVEARHEATPGRPALAAQPVLPPGEHPAPGVVKEPAPEPASPARPSVVRHVVTTTPAAPPESTTDKQLAAERALLERARSALLRSHPADALAALRQHEQTFPDGKLIEEREALRVLALAANGALGRAQEHARRFRARYPKSLLLPAVEAVLAGRPSQVADREKPRHLD